ncbi:hypothetical protein RFI_34273 [Reticulomyxa filosa]|uniref:Uncharacterized protein n=1 Tax=Reticulomyxa filosa TaxID=46433 RepID=X6LPQ8_RETFI|nr:hypothetical protein RFI_34273 [Reticulomyxa filosa]|eukprot:ETO03137.1 hypothetical protein RFI_34273 [Reticulomyxa filosa]
MLFFKTLLVHECQIFKSGRFNGDTHPDSTLLMTNGRLWPIDYGQLKCFSKEELAHLVELIIAMADRNLEYTVKKIEEMSQNVTNQFFSDNLFFTQSKKKIIKCKTIVMYTIHKYIHRYKFDDIKDGGNAKLAFLHAWLPRTFCSFFLKSLKFLL